MRLDRKARLERVLSGIGCYLSPIEVQLFPPHQSCLLALLHNLVKEAAKDLHPVASANTRETRMVGKRLAEVIAKVPHHAQPISSMAHQQAFRANTLEEHDALQFEKDHRINGRAACACIGLLHKLAHKREIEGSLQVSIEVIVRNQRIKGDIDERGKGALLPSHHGSTLSSSSILASSHGCRFLDGSGGRNHSEICAGCIVSWTTAISCSRKASRSTSWRSVELKVATILTASYLRR